MMLKKISALFVLSIISYSAFSQKGNYEIKEEIPFQPMFVIGSSYYSFQGDIKGPKTNALLGNIGYNAGVLFNLSKDLDCKLSFSNASFFEKNEDFEFSSNANVYSFNLNYGIKFSSNSKINPFTTAGISSISYKTYNSEDFDKEYALVLPLGLGLQLNISERIKLNVGVNYCLTNADIDKDELSNADNFLTANFNIAYDLFTAKLKATNYSDESFYNDVNYSMLEAEDSDGDGVLDFDDQCPYTPKNIKVDLDGCPLDDDLDGIPNHLDKEKNTAKGNIVDQFGVSYTKESTLFKRNEVASRRYANYYNENEINRSNYKNINDFLIAKANAFNKQLNIVKEQDSTKKFYRVKLDKYYEQVPATIINKYLSIEDLISISEDDGAVTYAVGAYFDVNEAIDRQTDLEEDNFNNTEIIIDIDGVIEKYKVDIVKNTDLNVTGNNDEKIVLKQESESINETQKKLITYKNSTDSIKTDKTSNPIYRIQIGAFKEILSKEIFTSVDDVVFFKGSDGIYRYNSGSFDNYNQAVSYLQEMRLRGFEDAFIATYLNGKRVGLSNILSKTSLDTSLEKKSELTNNTKKSKKIESINKPVFSIQIGIFSNNLSATQIKNISKLPSVKTKKISDKLSTYFIENISNLEEAEITLSTVKSMGFDKAFIIKTKNGKRLSFKN